MTWANSAIFQQAMLNPIAGRCWSTAAPTGFGSLSADTVDGALFNNSVTPDKTAVVGSTGYNTGTWLTANEQTDPNWAAGGRALGTKAFAVDSGSSSVCFSAANLTGAGNVTLANVYGILVYDATISGGTVAKQGLCYNYFGGAQSVTAGTFTVVWATPPGGAVTAVFNISV